MKLTQAEVDRIYEEEKVRREARGYTPTDWLSSCIMAPLIVVGLLIVGLVIFVGFLIATNGH